mmetsp:Transcript_19718/g.27499  ORF Transcript_19718/g.27499 Transcript_19718/m.27499 type:complete len:85 (-) Transcript_19718:386-640(-)
MDRAQEPDLTVPPRRRTTILHLLHHQIQRGDRRFSNSNKNLKEFGHSSLSKTFLKYEDPATNRNHEDTSINDKVCDLQPFYDTR